MKLKKKVTRANIVKVASTLDMIKYLIRDSDKIGIVRTDMLKDWIEECINELNEPETPNRSYYVQYRLNNSYATLSACVESKTLEGVKYAFQAYCKEHNLSKASIVSVMEVEK